MSSHNNQSALWAARHKAFLAYTAAIDEWARTPARDIARYDINLAKKDAAAQAYDDAVDACRAAKQPTK